MSTQAEDTLKWKAVEAAFALCAYVEHNNCSSRVTKDAAAAFLDACAQREQHAEFKAMYQNRAKKLRV